MVVVTAARFARSVHAERPLHAPGAELFVDRDSSPRVNVLGRVFGQVSADVASIVVVASAVSRHEASGRACCDLSLSECEDSRLRRIEAELVARFVARRSFVPFPVSPPLGHASGAVSEQDADVAFIVARAKQGASRGKGIVFLYLDSDCAADHSD